MRTGVQASQKAQYPIDYRENTLNAMRIPNMIKVLSQSRDIGLSGLEQVGAYKLPDRLRSL